MFVVRFDDAGELQFKAFSTLPRAEQYFNRVWIEVSEGAYPCVALYEVPATDDARVACEAVRNSGSDIRLIKLEESEGVRLDRIARELAPKLEIKL
jgi:hypothetical protein